ncbi:MAG: Gfo/Idh/MocA family protein [Candidatus Hydrogenedentota bacterium]
MDQDKKAGMTRRDFAKATAAATAFGILHAKPGKAETNGETIRIGLIGCGGRGGGAVLNCLTGNENVKLVAMADVFEDKLEGKRADMEKKAHGSIKKKIDVADDMCFVGLDAYQKLLATDVDMIIHGTPPYARPQHITAAVDAGKHIFTEKPVAVDPVGIRQFMAAAKKAEEQKLSFVTGTQRRHQQPYLETIEQIHDGAIGEVLAARAYWCGSLPFAHEREEGWSDLEYQLRNWYNYVWTCGDNIVEQHIHNIDIINWVMGGPPAKAFASGGRAWKPRDVNNKYGNIWDNFSVDYEYPNGVHLLSMSRHWNDSANAVMEEVTGTKGKSNCRDLGSGDNDPYVQEQIDLVKSIRGEGPYLNEGVRTAESTLTAIMGRMAAFSGKLLTWDDALNSDVSIVPKDLDFDTDYPVRPIAEPPSAI